jgi:hypothetical protein
MFLRFYALTGSARAQFVVQGPDNKLSGGRNQDQSRALAKMSRKRNR